MKIISFNINGIRARPHQLEAMFAAHDPDIVGLQETKCPDDQFPVEAIRGAGYHVAFFGQKSHYGVALLSKQEPETVLKGFPTDEADAQRRLIAGSWTLPSGRKLHVLNGYFPQGENRDHETKFPAKRAFYADLQAYLASNHAPEDHVVVMGDLNIAPTDKDIGIGAANAKRWLRQGACAFLPEEREWFARLEGWGLSDAFRFKYPEVEDRFSWFDYRSRGFDREPRRGLRIDQFMLTRPMRDALMDTGIDYDLRGMVKPSDHAPIWADFDLG